MIFGCNYKFTPPPLLLICICILITPHLGLRLFGVTGGGDGVNANPLTRARDCDALVAARNPRIGYIILQDSGIYSKHIHSTWGVGRVDSFEGSLFFWNWLNTAFLKTVRGPHIVSYYMDCIVVYIDIKCMTMKYICYL